MNKLLSVLFLSLKFHYYHYNLLLNNSKRLHKNFFKNNIITKKSLNLNFLLEKYWILSDKQTWYYLGLNSLLFGFKTKNHFFKYIKDNFSFTKDNSIFNNFIGSNCADKNSKKFWKYKFISVILNFSDWAVFFRNNLKKSKVLFLFGNLHPIQNILFKNLKKYDFDEYNNNELNFNVNISDNNDMNYNKKMLLSELFFFNNKFTYITDIDNDFFMFFFIKVNRCSSLFYHNKFFFKFPIFFNFYASLLYPYYFANNSFFLSSEEDTRLISDLFFDKKINPLLDSIDPELNSLLFLKYTYLVKNTIFILEYKFFITMFSINL